MTQDEATARGIKLSETKHSMKRRSPWHDYSRKGTYMLTLVINGRQPLFGTLQGKADTPKDSDEAPHVELSPLGLSIQQEEILKINQFYPQVAVWKLCIMPDHMHIIVHVKEDMADGKHLGQIVKGFKTGCTRAWWRLSDGESSETVATIVKETKGTTPTVASASPKAPKEATLTVALASPKAQRPVLFEKGYNDKILLHEGQLENWEHYLEDNPRRLLLKRQNPQLFTILSGMAIAGEQCQIVGNRFLLDIPDKMAVIVHRRYSDEENAQLREAWLACGERGGVLVSAAISPKEKEVLREAMNRGYSIILLREKGFSNYYKPSGEAFDACAQGQLLQISPWQYHMERKTITRQQCLHLNDLAERIVSNSFHD